ncbi:hypothetical protein GCM10028803_21130 [Larkinella knui]|uniref:DUF4974 domain-containing protein n=1 Tax=Larkinella knui TaxID=2025310 RepID=A0A3P1CVC1_9BACT|nr:FecR domain-containing protein [Larkinella knui]RRB17198.1 DUF4974 domain-containing protein [Larkinella knui]
MKFDHYTADDFLMDDSFVAYRRGTDSGAIAFWTHWQSGQPANLPEFREAERIYDLLSGQKPGLEESFSELQMLITKQQPTPEVIDWQPQRTGFRTGWWAVAASLLLVGGLGGYWFWQNQTISYQTDYGQQKTVSLPDGSTVTLNSHSKLQHRRNWTTGDSRDVTLDGEGFFAVRHLETEKPFRVITGDSFTVQVLGTEFTMTHRAGLNRVVLNRGRVRVGGPADGATLTLEPGQLAELDATGTLIRRNVPPERYNAWLRNQFVFEGATLPEAVRQVEEQFGIQIRFNSADVSNRRFTGILPLRDPEKVVNTLASYHHLKVSHEGKSYVLTR